MQEETNHLKGKPRAVGTKVYLFLGILLLTAGFIMKLVLIKSIIPTLLFSLGGTSKLAFVTVSIIRNEYKPGWELLLLFAGLSIFFYALYLKNHHYPNYLWIMLSGIGLKVVFIILFILRKSSQNQRKVS